MKSLPSQSLPSNASVSLAFLVPWLSNYHCGWSLNLHSHLPVSYSALLWMWPAGPTCSNLVFSSKNPKPKELRCPGLCLGFSTCLLHPFLLCLSLCVCVTCSIWSLYKSTHIWFSLEIPFFPKCLTYWKGPLSSSDSSWPSESPAKSFLCRLLVLPRSQLCAEWLESPQRVTCVATVLEVSYTKMGLSLS